MAKFPKVITKKEQESLFIDFAQAIATLRSPVEIAQFIKDLLSEPETTMLARRLQIAKLLDRGLTYDEIRKSIKVSFGTIARVQTWLQMYGEGYRTVLERTKKKEEPVLPRSEWSKLKHRYPQYYWPQLLLEEIVKSSSARQKQKLTKTLADLREKTSLSRHLEQILKSADL